MTDRAFDRAGHRLTLTRTSCYTCTAGLRLRPSTWNRAIKRVEKEVEREPNKDSDTEELSAEARIVLRYLVQLRSEYGLT